jgi:hypothetical protein
MIAAAKPFKTILFSVAICALAVHGVAQVASAFRPGDVITGGQTPGMSISGGRFDWFTPDGTLIKRMADTIDEFPFDLAFDNAGNLYAPTFFTIRVFDRTGTFVGFFPRFIATNLTAIVFDNSGAAYVSGGFGTGSIAKLDGAGNIVRIFQPPHDNSAGILSAFDLAADQCTVIYPSAQHILRYDVCRDTPLTELVAFAPGGFLGRLRILPDGRVLIIRANTILLIGSDGSVMKSYQVAGVANWFHLAIDINRQSFWATANDRAYKIDIATGGVVMSFPSSDYLMTRIAVVGEPRAASAPSSIPAFAPAALVALALSLAVIALISLRSSAGIA